MRILAFGIAALIAGCASNGFAYCSGYTSPAGETVQFGEPEEDQASFTALDGTVSVCSMDTDQRHIASEIFYCADGLVDAGTFRLEDIAAPNKGDMQFRGETWACGVKPANG